eukprot:UN4276
MTHPNPSSAADRCAYAVWCMALLFFETGYMLICEDDATRTQQHSIVWYPLHCVMALYVVLCTFEKEHLEKCGKLNDLVWPRVEAVKTSVVQRCPYCKSPWRVGILSTYLGGLVALDRVGRPMTEEVGCIWFAIFILTALRVLMDVLVFLWRCCCGCREKHAKTEKTD